MILFIFHCAQNSMVIVSNYKVFVYILGLIYISEKISKNNIIICLRFSHNNSLPESNKVDFWKMVEKI